VSGTWGDVIDENAFTAPIHLELSQSPAPFSQHAQRAGAQHLELAHMHADAGRTSEALAEYAKAADSDDPSIRAAALAGSKDLLSWQTRLGDWAVDQLVLLGLVGFNIALIVALFVLGRKLALGVGFLRRICRHKDVTRRLEIEPLSYWPSSEKTYTHFREIVNWTRALMNEQYLLKQRAKISQESTILPTIVFETSLRDWEVPLSLVSEKAWPVLLSLFRLVNPADYVLEGSLSSHDGNYHVVLRLLRASETAQIWERPIAKGDLTNGLKDLAHAVLTWIVKQGPK